MLRWIMNFVVTSTLRAELELNRGDVTNRPILDNT
jgi:hypothetical protein